MADDFDTAYLDQVADPKQVWSHPDFKQFGGDKSVHAYASDAGQVYEDLLKEHSPDLPDIGERRKKIEGQVKERVRQNVIDEAAKVHAGRGRVGSAEFAFEKIPFAGSAFSIPKRIFAARAKERVDKGEGTADDYDTLGMQQAEQQTIKEESGAATAARTALGLGGGLSEILMGGPAGLATGGTTGAAKAGQLAMGLVPQGGKLARAAQVAGETVANAAAFSVPQIIAGTAERHAYDKDNWLQAAGKETGSALIENALFSLSGALKGADQAVGFRQRVANAAAAMLTNRELQADIGLRPGTGILARAKDPEQYGEMLKDLGHDALFVGLLEGVMHHAQAERAAGRQVDEPALAKHAAKEYVQELDKRAVGLFSEGAHKGWQERMDALEHFGPGDVPVSKQPVGSDTQRAEELMRPPALTKEGQKESRQGKYGPPLPPDEPLKADDFRQALLKEHDPSLVRTLEAKIAAGMPTDQLIQKGFKNDRAAFDYAEWMKENRNAPEPSQAGEATEVPAGAERPSGPVGESPEGAERAPDARPAETPISAESRAELPPGERTEGAEPGDRGTAGAEGAGAEERGAERDSGPAAAGEKAGAETGTVSDKVARMRARQGAGDVKATPQPAKEPDVAAREAVQRYESGESEDPRAIREREYQIAGLSELEANVMRQLEFEKKTGEQVAATLKKPDGTPYKGGRRSVNEIEKRARAKLGQAESVERASKAPARAENKAAWGQHAGEVSVAELKNVPESGLKDMHSASNDAERALNLVMAELEKAHAEGKVTDDNAEEWVRRFNEAEEIALGGRGARAEAPGERAGRTGPESTGAQEAKPELESKGASETRESFDRVLQNVGMEPGESPDWKSFSSPKTAQELDFQRDAGRELVYALRDAEGQQAKDSLAKALRDLGAEAVGEPGKKVEFDGRWQTTDEPLEPGDSVEVVQPGWRLSNERGTFLLGRASVTRRSSEQDPVVQFAKQFMAGESGTLDLQKIKEYVAPKLVEARSALTEVSDQLHELGGGMVPRTTRLDRATGEALARFAAAKTYGQELGHQLKTEVLGNAPKELREKAGAVITELNLRHTRDYYQKAVHDASKRAYDARLKGDKKAAAEAAAEVGEAIKLRDGVETVVGKAWSPFATDADFQAAQRDPAVQSALQQYAKVVPEKMNDNYRRGRGLDPTDPINAPTQHPTLPVNLLASEEAGQMGPSPDLTSGPGGGKGNLGNLAMGKYPFARQRKGNARRYVLDLGEIIENSMERGTFNAAKAEAARTAVENGVGKLGNKGEQHEGYRQLNFFDPPEGTPGRDEIQRPALYLQEPAYKEFRKALNVDKTWGAETLKPITDKLTKGALVSTVEAAYHIKNILSTIADPGMGPVALAKNLKAVLDGTPEIQARLTELARTASLKPQGSETPILGPKSKYNPLTWMSGAIDVGDRAMRLTRADAFESLVRRGKMPNTETAERDFINQLGQYHLNAQHGLVKLLRDTGIGPFAVAGTNFLSQGVHAVTGGTGVRGANPALRAEKIARNLALAYGVSALGNYLLWGNVTGDDSTPFGELKLGEYGGKTITLPIGAMLSPLSRGLRATGATALIEGKRRGLGTEQIKDNAVSDIGHSLLHPAEGPAVQFGKILLTGENTFGHQVAEKPLPGESHAGKNLAAAGKEANPLVSTGMDLLGSNDPGHEKSVLETLSRMLGPFGVKFRSNPYVHDFFQTEKDVSEQRREALRRGVILPDETQIKHHVLEKAAPAMRKLSEGFRKSPDEEVKGQIRQRQGEVAKAVMERVNNGVIPQR